MTTPLLWFRGEAGGGAQVVLPEGPCVIGRDESADLVVPASETKYVSRRHARLTRAPQGVVIEDLQSANGTYVNGRRIERATLADGDEVQLGRHGPVARFYADLPPTGAMLPSAGTAAAERPSVVVRKAVDRAVASHTRTHRRRLVLAATTAAGLSALLAFALMRGRAPDLPPAAALAGFAGTYADRVALIEVGLVHDGGYVSLGVGSGFFVSEDGLVVTNKHVVRPDLFSEHAACLLASLEARGSVAFEMTLWPGATPFRRDLAAPGDRSLGYRTSAGTLSVMALAADALAPEVTIPCEGIREGQAFTFTTAWRRHVNDDNDLALLRVHRGTAARAMALASRPAAPGDMVLVLGFPNGFDRLEGLVAEPVHRVGRVLNAAGTIETDAVVLHGNSGGPLIDVSGSVVGVATRGPAESLNSAIKVEHVRRLVERFR